MSIKIFPEKDLSVQKRDEKGNGVSNSVDATTSLWPEIVV